MIHKMKHHLVNKFLSKINYIHINTLLPAGQTEQFMLSFVKVPAVHNVQFAAPSCEVVPFGHSIQVSASSNEYVPAGHSLQSQSSQNVPEGQVVVVQWSPGFGFGLQIKKLELNSRNNANVAYEVCISWNKVE